MTAKSHPAAMRFIPDQLPRESISNNLVLSDSLTREPARYCPCEQLHSLQICFAISLIEMFQYTTISESECITTEYPMQLLP